jgi:hypothetical protein
MKGAASWGGVLVIAVCAVAGTALASDTDVTDRDRLWANFTREAAVVGAKQFWLELQGMVLMDDQSVKQTDNQGATFKGPTLGLNGYPINKPACSSAASATTPTCIESIDGGRLDLVGAYGLGANAEVGLDLPFLMQQQIKFVDGSHQSFANVGDLLLYGKIKRQLEEHWAAALGLEISIPTGSRSKYLGSGDLGLNPVLSTRYQGGPLALGAHVGFLLNTGTQSDVFNWDVDAIVRVTAPFALRCEVNGRQFRDFGENYTDISIWPGMDFNLTDYFIIRPQGVAHLTNDALDWGLGIAFVFTL